MVTFASCIVYHDKKNKLISFLGNAGNQREEVNRITPWNSIRVVSAGGWFPPASQKSPQGPPEPRACPGLQGERRASGCRASGSDRTCRRTHRPSTYLMLPGLLAVQKYVCPYLRKDLCQDRDVTDATIVDRMCVLLFLVHGMTAVLLSPVFEYLLYVLPNLEVTNLTENSLVIYRTHKISQR